MAARRDWRDLVELGNPSQGSSAPASANLAEDTRMPVPAESRPATADAVVIDNVIVPLDGSDGSRTALPIGRALAQLYGATLHVTYIEPDPGETHPRQTLQELGLGRNQQHGVVMDHLRGDVPAAILNSARRLPSALLVMCSHSGTHSDTGLGPIADAVLSGTPARIVLVLPEYASQDWQLRRILLAHDGSRSADVAIAPTADLAHRSGAEVLALHVGARSCAEPEEPGSLPAPRYVDQPHHEWPAWTSEFLDRMLGVGASPGRVNFKLLVTGGQPGSEIAEFTRDNEVSLLVVAWRGRWEEERSETLKVIIRRSGCPVLLIYAAGDKEDSE